MEWYWQERGGLKWLKMRDWERKGVTAAFTTRVGGQSSGPYDSLNLGLHVGDDPEVVIANREMMVGELGFSLDRMVCAEQVHGNQVAVLDLTKAGRGSRDYHDSLSGFDGLVTDTPGLFLTAFFADCIPVYFFDPRLRVVALAHSGWKGTVGQVAINTLQTMVTQFKCRIQDILVFIGPGIGAECYLIDEARMHRVEQVFTFSRRILYSNIKGQGWEWDLKETIRLGLFEAGVPETNIDNCHLCTACNTELFFSYRVACGRPTGRMAAIIGLEPVLVSSQEEE